MLDLARRTTLRQCSLIAVVAGATLLVAAVGGLLGPTPGGALELPWHPRLGAPVPPAEAPSPSTVAPTTTATELAPTTATTTTVAPTTTVAAPAQTEPPVTEPPATEAPVDPLAPVIEFALAQVGKPYVFAAAGPNAYDCSGLVLAAYRQIGIPLAHYSVTQARAGRAVDWRHEALRPGDLVLLRGGNPVIDLGHIGMVVAPGRWVVAPAPGQFVRVEPIPTGIQAVRRLVEP